MQSSQVKSGLMLLPLTWSHYMICIAVGLAVYYLVLARVYRKTLISVVQDKFKNPTPVMQPMVRVLDKQHDTTTYALKENDQTNSLDPIVHDLVDEIQAYTIAAGEEEGKAALLKGLKIILKKYKSIENSHLRESIDELISLSCENNCAVSFSEDEIRGFWEGPGRP